MRTSACMVSILNQDTAGSKIKYKVISSMTLSPRWTVAIFSSRETSDVLQKTVRAAIVACADVPSTVEILVNGNPGLVHETSVFLDTLSPKPTSCTVRLWHIAGADKSHTWNQFLYQIAPANELTFFIDGYVWLKSDALRLLAHSLEENPDALAGTGVPTAGQTAATLKKAMLTSGGMHGNLYCVRHTVLEKLKESGFKLPVGLYRNDSLLGAIFYYNLNPAQFKWTPSRVVVNPTATWDLSTHKSSIWSYMLMIWKRRVRQCQGALENIAVRDHLSLQRRPPHELSSSAALMVTSWVRRNRFKAFKVFCSSPITYHAYSKLRRPKLLSGLDIAPQLSVRQSNTKDNAFPP